MLLRLFLIMLLSVPTATLAAPAILIYGDSLSAGYGVALDQSWAHLLQQRLQRSGYSHVVVNASISGETTSGGLVRIEQALSEHHPQIVILELGANDGLRGLSLQQMRNNLKTMITACQRHRARVLLLGMRIPPNYGPRYTEDFMESYPRLAKAQAVALVEFMLDGVAGHAELMQEDGLHPTASAQPMLLNKLWPQLLSLLGKPVAK